MNARLVPVIDPAALAESVRRLGEQISHEYAGLQLVLVGVLKGAFVFTADLVRALHIPAQVDFVRLASYYDSDSPGEAKLLIDLEIDCRGKHVLVVEDIVDTGHSMQMLLAALKRKGAASVRLCALVDKTERREVEVTVDFYGFKLAKGFVVGYGMDYAENHRCLPGVFELDIKKDDLS